MQRVVASALRAASIDGITRCYFISNKRWEARFRHAFSTLPASISEDPVPVRTDTVERLRRLAIDYRANRSKPNYELVYDAIVFEVQNGWNANPPKLLDGSQEDLEQISAALNRVVDYARDHDEVSKKNHYSFITKCLHFLFPHSFAIFDGQALASIGVIASHHLDKTFRRRFPKSQIGLPGGYGKLLGFYKEFWAAVQHENLVADFQSAAQDLERVLRSVPGCEDAQVTIVDVIDKFLYKTNGDESELGLM